MTTSPHPLLDAQQTVLQPMVHGLFSASKRLLDSIRLADAEQDQALRIWHRGELNQHCSAAELATLPPRHAARLRGWQAYYADDYCRAQQEFAAGLDALPAGEASGQATQTLECALGLGKVYTRSGHWHHARQWTLYALALARRDERLFDCVRSYGALGEIFLRSGHPQAAHFCLSTAHQLLPPGAGDRPRQWNYLASALMRLDDNAGHETALALLMQSLYLALDSGDRISASHALARLQFRELDFRPDSAEPVFAADDIVSGSLSAISERLTEVINDDHHYTAVPRGMLAIGRAFVAHRRGDLATAQAFVDEACNCLSEKPAELAWAEALAQALSGNAEALPGKPAPSPVILTAPELDSPVDEYWKQLPLDNPGPLAYVPPQGDIPALLAHRKVFFL